MLQLRNSTPFVVGIHPLANEKGRESLYIAIKATFEIKTVPEIAAEQLPLIHEDEYRDEPGDSSLRYASEIHLTKPATDVVMEGCAQAPDRRRVNWLDVVLSVGKLAKTVRVFGDRQWDGGLVAQKATKPEPFEVMPLIYERAFGGRHEVDVEKGEVLWEERNPVGRGFRGERRRREMVGLELANLEDPRHLISGISDRPPPAGFGFVAPSWYPRYTFAGTYDESWQRERVPYLPEDFDPRFFNVAHPDLVCRGYLRGGEPVRVRNASPHGPLRFALPECRLDAAVRIRGRTERPALHLETVLLEPEEPRLVMLWRGMVECRKSGLEVERVDVRLLEMEGAKG